MVCCCLLRLSHKVAFMFRDGGRRQIESLDSRRTAGNIMMSVLSGRLKVKIPLLLSCSDRVDKSATSFRLFSPHKLSEIWSQTWPSRGIWT